MIDGAVLLRLLTFILTRANSNPIAPGTFRPIGGLGAVLAASIALVVFGSSAASTNLALLLTGAPIVLFGGGYFLWLACVLTFGRKARWN
jgi:hypothetical protein